MDTNSVSMGILSRAVLVRDDLVGRTLERVLITLCPPSLSVIRTHTGEPSEVRAITDQVRDCDSRFVGLEIMPHEITLPSPHRIQRCQPSAALTCALACLGKASSGTDDELRGVVLELTDVHRGLRQHLHNLANDITSGRIRREPVRFWQGLTLFSADLLRYGFETPALVAQQALQTMVSTKLEQHSLDGLSKMLAGIEGAIFGGEIIGDDIRESLPSAPPDGYSTILVADDDGYPVECTDILRGFGYEVWVLTDRGEVFEELQHNPAAIFLCDMTWGREPEAGNQMMEFASQQIECRVIIALSGSKLTKDNAPYAHEICAGPEAKIEQGARKVHEIIWQQALAHYAQKASE